MAKRVLGRRVLTAVDHVWEFSLFTLSSAQSLERGREPTPHVDSERFIPLKSITDIPALLFSRNPFSFSAVAPVCCWFYFLRRDGTGFPHRRMLLLARCLARPWWSNSWSHLSRVTSYMQLRKVASRPLRDGMKKCSNRVTTFFCAVFSLRDLPFLEEIKNAQDEMWMGKAEDPFNKCSRGEILLISKRFCLSRNALELQFSWSVSSSERVSIQGLRV